MMDKTESMEKLEAKLNSLEEENKKIRTEHEDLIREISKVREYGSRILECARTVHTGRDIVHKRAEENKEANKSLEEWKKTCEYKLEKIKEEIKGFALSSAMISVMSIDSYYEKIPWAYYDFVNQELYYSPAALKLLKIESTKTKSNLKGLLSYITPVYRRGIEESLRSGEGLKHYKAKTSLRYSNKTQELMLSTYPFYDDKEKAVGTAIFLRDPKISLHSRGIHRFEKNVQKIISRIFEQLNEHPDFL